jgi:hypothetical protein
MSNSMSEVQVCAVDIVMAPAASPVASELDLWLKIDDSFTTDGKIVMCLASNESIGVL